jgi:nicotinate-nucleotide adenylyltransferase
MEKIGLFFGSFNPVHNGHLMLANYILEFGNLDQVWFVVSPHNPLKPTTDLLPENQRLDLVRYAIGDFDRFKLCDIEFGMPRPSFTIDTLTLLSSKHPEKHFSLIIGSDSLDSFNHWKDFETILSRYTLLVYPREGRNESNPLQQHPSVIRIAAPQIEVSSSFIRDGLKQGKDLRFFMPKGIFERLKGD